MYFVYVLQSKSTGQFYVGQCDHLIDRFHRHQAGRNKATKGRGPWWMPYYEVFDSRSEAAKRERSIKAKKSADSIRRIIMRAIPSLELMSA